MYLRCFVFKCLIVGFLYFCDEYLDTHFSPTDEELQEAAVQSDFEPVFTLKCDSVFGNGSVLIESSHCAQQAPRPHISCNTSVNNNSSNMQIWHALCLSPINTNQFKHLPSD